MGSIQVFPGSGDAARKRRIVDAWRSEPVPGSGAPAVHAARLADYAAIRALQKRVNAANPWTLKQLESHLRAFPAGQLVVEDDGEIVAAASSLIVRWDEYAVNHTWKAVTGDGFFTTHDVSGRTLYCAEWVVNLTRRGYGLGRLLCQAQRRLCRTLNLRRIIGAVRLPGYRALRDAMSPELYVKRAIWGDMAEATLRLPVSQGFQYCGVIRDYMPEDGESCGNAALVVWLNPLFAPAEPPANIDRERRRCA